MTSLASVVYKDLGDYTQILPSWLGHSGVLAYLDEVGGSDRVANGPISKATKSKQGFILLGFYEPSGESVTVADLLAIAIEPDRQRQGLGRCLLRYAIELATMIGARNKINEIRLTVADSNTPGRRLFTSAGFQVLDANHGVYDGGQRAIRMTRTLAPSMTYWRHTF